MRKTWELRTSQTCLCLATGRNKNSQMSYTINLHWPLHKEWRYSEMNWLAEYNNVYDCGAIIWMSCLDPCNAWYHKCPWHASLWQSEWYHKCQLFQYLSLLWKAMLWKQWTMNWLSTTQPMSADQLIQQCQPTMSFLLHTTKLSTAFQYHSMLHDRSRG